MNSLRAGILFLLLQVAAILSAQLTPHRYFCWAPFHAQTKYQIKVWLDNKELTEQEISARYRQATLFWDVKTRQWWELNKISHVFALISQYETTYGAHEQARFVIDYDETGHGLRSWTWPTP
jgi:hypothetical protein